MRTRSILPIAVAVAVAAPLLAATPAAAAPHQSGLHFGTIQYDTPGADRRTNTAVNGEWVNIHNNSRSTVQLKGYKVKDNNGYTYTFGSFKLGAGKTVKLRTGKGGNTSATRYWGRSWYVWNNTSDKARLIKPNGSLQDSCSWTTRDRGTKNCH
ncbi:lamin tail domain-containing protein [Streptomyces sp. NPDC049906]|uniref:lamin tail domain-containing protein n=1 Tax=Streptomyces sp. NPDC049906 TaxID=3155656 RepID=UPI003441A1B9